MKLTKISLTGKKTKVDVSDDLFAVPFNPALLSQAVRVYLSNLRQGTSKTQTRSDVNRTTKKLYRQKGTGNARHGARTANIFVGGAVAHGPTGEQNWKKKLPKKMKKLALRIALSLHAKDDNIIICDAIDQLDGKTKSAFLMLEKIGVSKEKNIVIVTETDSDLIMRSFMNIKNVNFTNSTYLNLLHVVFASKILITGASIKALEKRLIGETK